MQNFKCNTCNKVAKLDNVYSRCMLTKNCTGKLSRTMLTNFNISDFKTQVFTFEQSIPLSIWRIKHSLNDNPLVMVYDSNNKQIFDFEIFYIDGNILKIDFGTVKSGTAQLMISNNISKTIIPKKSISFEKISNDGYITPFFVAVDKSYILPE